MRRLAGVVAKVRVRRHESRVAKGLQKAVELVDVRRRTDSASQSA